MRHRLSLLTDEPQHTVQHLQGIGEALLREYKLTLWEGFVLTPLAVDAMYVNRKSGAPFIDTNMHCMADDSAEAETIGRLQSGRLGRIYWHLRGTGGIDICLSDSPAYALCYTLRAARVDGVEVWGVTKVRDAVRDAYARHLAIADKEEARTRLIAMLHSGEAPCTLQPHSEGEVLTEGELYCIARSGLRKRDSHHGAPLRMLLDIWADGNGLTKNQRVMVYMKQHPDADLIDVLRAQGFRHIPTDLRYRFGVPNGTKLY